MINRKEVKEKARQHVRKRYGLWLLVSLVSLLSMLAGSLNTPAEPNTTSLWVDGFGILLALFTVPLFGIGLDAVRDDSSNVSVSFSRRLGPMFWRNLWGMLLMNLKVLLWTLLFIVPGIVAGYRYYFVPYLLADDDTLTIQEAFEQSAAMTDNRKFDLFVYDLSFVGWAFLVVLTAGIAAFFVAPYIEASRIQLYEELRG